MIHPCPNIERKGSVKVLVHAEVNCAWGRWPKCIAPPPNNTGWKQPAAFWGHYLISLIATLLACLTGRDSFKKTALPCTVALVTLPLVLDCVDRIRPFVVRGSCALQNVPC